MAKKTARQRQRVHLHYPKHIVSPEDLLHFIETTVFTSSWADLGLNDEDDLTALQLSIMCSPKACPVIPGTGGLRKMRYTPPDAKIGKRGGYRVCYVYFEDYWTVLLVCIYDKHQKDDLTASEVRAIRNYLLRARKALESRREL